MKISILELGYRSENDSVSNINDIIEYAIELDHLGFSRFWLAEHHYSHIKNLSFTNPDVLIGIIAGMTNTINVGAAGISIPSHSPYDVVTNYKLLNNLFYNRIDLGLSKGVAESIFTKQLMNSNLNEKNIRELFEQNIKIIVDLIFNEEKNLIDKGVLIPPYKGIKPQLWYLSTSFKNIKEAIGFHCNYCVSLFHKSNDINNIDAIQINEYKNNFFRTHGVMPSVALAIAVNIDSENQNRTLEQGESFRIADMTITELFDYLAGFKKIGIDEFVIFDTSDNNEAKIRNARRISEKFNLKNG